MQPLSMLTLGVSLIAVSEALTYQIGGDDNNGYGKSFSKVVFNLGGSNSRQSRESRKGSSEQVRTLYAAPRQTTYSAPRPQPRYQIVTVPQPQRTYRQPSTTYRLVTPRGGSSSESGSQESYGNKNAAYEFAYEVRDDYTSNYQARQESRDGKVVQGVYRVVDPDGYLRVVTYGDKGDGFYANVERFPQTIFKALRTYSRSSESNEKKGY